MKATRRALLGLAIAAAAPLLYLGWAAKNVAFGELTWPWWLAIAIGVLIAARAVVKPPAGATTRDRVVAGACLALAMGAAGLFAVYVRGMSYDLPAPVWTKLDLGRELPDVTLVASDGRQVNLRAEARDGALAKKKILLSFFRGHW